MAEQQQPQQQPALAALFPNPPPFWQNFTPENLDRISELRAKEGGEKAKKHDPTKELLVRLLDLPPELRLLQPPEPPANDIYKVFGDNYNFKDPLPTLEELGIQQLYTPPATPIDGKHADRAFILKKIAKSLLLNFLELVGIMAQNPEQCGEKIEDLRTLFINFHHLLNEYRPHQAREGLILMMQDQLDRSRAETDGIRQMKEKVEGILEGLSQAKLAETEEEKVETTEEWREEEEGRDIWEELQRQFG